MLHGVFFYTLRGIFGTTPDWVNIGIFFVSAAGGFLLETRLLYRQFPPYCHKQTAIWGFALLTVLFWVFTFFPPEIPLFCDPTDGSYGISR